MRILKHVPPKLIMPEFLCDIPLSKKIDNELLKNMNKSFATAFIGKAGSGKTSLMTSFLQTPNFYKKVFHQIFLFMPHSSRKSMTKDIFDDLPQSQKFEGVTFDDLNDVYLQLLENSKENKFTLLIFDDVQSYFKDSEIEKNLIHLIANRRHLRLSLFIVAQNYKKIPLQVRMTMSDFFLFNVSPQDYKFVFDEILNIEKKQFIEILRLYNIEKHIQKNSFLYIHDFNKIFINWNEMIIDDEI